MVSKVGRNYACLFVGHVEQQIREKYTGFIPQLHKMCIDDIALCRREELEAFADLVSNFRPSLQSHRLSLIRNYHFLTSTCTFLMVRFKPLSSTRKQILTTASISLLFILNTASVLSSQFLHLRRLCSYDNDFLVKSRDMTTFFAQRGYPCSSLDHDLRGVTSISHPEALSGSGLPVVLTYHPLSIQIKLVLLQNFHILSTDQQTRDIFPRLPFVSYKGNLSLRNMLVRSTDNSSTKHPGSYACQRSRCHTCEYINPGTEIRGP